MPSRESLRSPGRRVRSTGLCTLGNQLEREREREREREKERKKERHRDPSSDGTKVL